MGRHPRQRLRGGSVVSHELVIGEERFACNEELSAWALMKLAKAAQGSEMAALAGMYDLVVSVIMPDERERFDAFMADHNIPFDELNTSIGALMTSYTDRPTDRPSLSQPGPTPNAGQSRVVSLSPRAATQQQSSKDGAREVS